MEGEKKTLRPFILCRSQRPQLSLRTILPCCLNSCPVSKQICVVALTSKLQAGCIKPSVLSSHRAHWDTSRLCSDLRSTKFSCSICREQRHEASPPAPAPLLGPPLIAPAPRSRQTAHPPRLAGWQRPPPDAATGRNAHQSGRLRGQHRLRAAQRKPPEVTPEPEPGPSEPAQPGGGGDRGRRGEGGGGAAAEAQRRSSAVHRPDLPPDEEYDRDGQDGEAEGAGSAQPQSPRRGREVKL